MRVKFLGSLSVGDCGGAILAAAGSSSAKVADLPPGPETTPSLTVIWLGGAFHWFAAACTNMARAAAPALRICSQASLMAVEPPVPWIPIRVLP